MVQFSDFSELWTGLYGSGSLGSVQVHQLFELGSNLKFLQH